MIDLSESLVTLTEATKLLPRRRNGRKTKQPSSTNVATIYRWSTVGCRGVILETIQCGATRCTSKEALQRFFDALTTQAAGEPAPAPVTSRSRCASVKRAEQVLVKARI